MQHRSIGLLATLLVVLVLAGCAETLETAETEAALAPESRAALSELWDFQEVIECPQTFDLSQSQIQGSTSGPDPSVKGERSAKEAVEALLATGYHQWGWSMSDFSRLTKDDGAIHFGKSDGDGNVVAAVEAAPVAAKDSWMVTKFAYCGSEDPR